MEPQLSPLADTANQPAAPSSQQSTPKPKLKRKGVVINRYEIKDEKIRLFVTQGFFKKRWLLVGEIPVYEISNIETSGRELSLTWNNAEYVFTLKNKKESFGGLRDLVLGLIEEHRKVEAHNQSVNQRKSDLTAAINASTPIVDASFDVLMGLHEKRINWQIEESYAASLGNGLNINGKSMPPLILDFAKISEAIKKQTPKETSNAAFAALKAIHEYFDGLKAEEDPDLGRINKTAKNALLAYYTLNDLLFGRIIGEKDNNKELVALENTLQDLASSSNIRMIAEELKANMDRFGTAETGNRTLVVDTRALLGDQLKQIQL